MRAHRTYLRLKEKYEIDFQVICSSTASNDSETYEIDGINVQQIVSERSRKLNRKLSSTPLRRFTNAALSHIEARSVTKQISETSFDVIHTFGYSPATIAAVNWSRKHKVPLIMELVNPMPNPYQYLPGSRLYSDQDLNHQSLIVAISQSLGDMCKSHGLIDNVWVRPNPVDTSHFSPPSERTRNDARSTISSATDDEILIVYVAKYIARKNHSFLLEVMAHLPENFRLVLAGPPQTENDTIPGLTAGEIPYLDARAKELGVGDRVEISHGFVDMLEYLSAADVFCFPSAGEAMGTPLIESIATGVPVVANASEPAFREWVIDGENGYLSDLNSERWAEAVINAAKLDADKKAAMSANIKSAISTEVIDGHYNKLLTELAAMRPEQQLNVEQVLSS
ncbi:glycosyltransferase family 4 protein [Candidatus Lucifugimonas marina]|uniref:glycosyltransferase family 4 protein n=1 Tax=Candidatus Lucifugimonas marina TaxID=3038979 RepID=UPI00319DD88F